MSDDHFDDYKTGYKKPPRHSQFKKGQSGNPGGRPKDRTDFKSDLARELAEPIRVREGEKTITVSKQRALVKRLMSGGLQGNPRMIAVLFSMIVRFLSSDDMTSGDEALNEDEREALAFLEQRILRKAQAAKTKPWPE